MSEGKMINLENIDGVKIVKIIYELGFDDLLKYMDEVLSIYDSVMIVNLLGSVPTCGSPNKLINNWDMALLDERSMGEVELILYKNDIGFELVDMTEEYHKEGSSLPEDFTKKIDDYIDTVLELDDVLDRMKEVGGDNITTFEKFFLERFSNQLIN